MKNSKYIIISILLIGLNSSCNDDFIEVENKQELTEESFWQTKEQALQGLTATYAAMQSATGSKWAFFEEMYIALAYRADDVVNNTSETYGKSLANFTNTTGESAPYNLWKASYAGIGRANQVLEKVPLMENLTDAEKKVIVAEAKFLRAYYYFWLVTGFENVPLVTTFVVDTDKLYPSQASLIEVWAQIEKDLLEAESDLLQTQEDQWLGRATQGSAKALLGKVYLFQEKWTDAEAKFAEVVQSGQYGLLPNYADNFNGKGENGIESVFEIQFSADRSNGNDERQVFNYEVSAYELGGWELFYPSDWLVEEMKTDLGEDGNPSERVYESIFFDDPNSKMYAIGSNTETLYTTVKNELNYPNYFKKYSKNVDEDTYNGTNIALIRYADVLLMYAEALNENGKTAEALAEINKVRTRGKAKILSTMSQDALRTQIRHHERPVELAMEYGIRWFDLYRWEKGSTAKESIKNTLQMHTKPFADNFQDKHMVFPIPLQEMNVNPNLNQNIGW